MLDATHIPLNPPHTRLTPPHIPLIFILYRADLEAQLAAMESKVLQGEAQGGLSELARRQEQVLRSQQQQLQRQRSKDAAKLRQIADMEEAALMAQGKYSSLQACSCCPLACLHTTCGLLAIEQTWKASNDNMKDNGPLVHGKYPCLQALVLLPFGLVCQPLFCPFTDLDGSPFMYATGFEWLPAQRELRV